MSVDAEPFQPQVDANVLIVEDSPSLAQLYHIYLMEEPYAVDIALDGETAMERLTHGEPVDVVLLDLQLPDMSGLECWRVWNLAPH